MSHSSTHSAPSLSWSIESLYNEYLVPIYNYIHRLVGNPEQAWDLTQDTFLKALQSLPRLDASARIRPWIYRIATNTAYDALRRRKSIKWLSLEELVEPSDQASGDPQEMVSDEVDRVRTALQKMRPSYRSALLLYEKGFSHAEIAQALTIAESGVKMYLSRARSQFRRHYQDLLVPRP